MRRCSREFALARLLHAQAAAYALDERCAAPFPDDVSGDLAALRRAGARPMSAVCVPSEEFRSHMLRPYSLSGDE